MVGSAPSTDFIELWNCPDDGTYTEYTEGYQCDDKLPSREKCQLVYVWTSAADNTMTLPNNVGFLAGYQKHFDKLIMVAKVQAIGTTFNVNLDITYTTSTLEHEAGTMTLGLKEATLSLPSGESSINIGNTCENTCALVGEWWVFSSSPLMHSYGRSISASYYRDGIYKRELLSDTDYTSRTETNTFTADPTSYLHTTERVEIGKDDVLVMKCNYDTSSATESIKGGNDYSTTEACYTFLNFYPRGSGIKTCLDNQCSNYSGDADFFTNVIVNYIALTFAAMLVGIIIGIVLYILVGVISRWFEENSDRFTKENFISFEWVSPMWWFQPYSSNESDEEENEKEKLVESDDEAKVTIPTDIV